MADNNFSLRLDPDPLLYQKLDPIDIEAYDLPSIEQSMIALMLENKGIGIAANQVGFDRRVVVVKLKNSEPFAMFNPIIVSGNEEKPDEEGCLSFPNLWLQVKRYNKITVEYLDKHKQKCIIELSDYDAKCVQHEIDHLDGINFTSRVSKLKLDLAKKKQRKINGRTK